MRAVLEPFADGFLGGLCRQRHGRLTSDAEIEKATARAASMVLQRYLRSERYTRAKASNDLGAVLESLLAVRLEAYITTRSECVDCKLTYPNPQVKIL